MGTLWRYYAQVRERRRINSLMLGSTSAPSQYVKTEWIMD